MNIFLLLSKIKIPYSSVDSHRSDTSFHKIKEPTTIYSLLLWYKHIALISTMDHHIFQLLISKPSLSFKAPLYIYTVSTAPTRVYNAHKTVAIFNLVFYFIFQLLLKYNISLQYQTSHYWSIYSLCYWEEEMSLLDYICYKSLKLSYNYSLIIFKSLIYHSSSLNYCRVDQFICLYC